MIVLGKICLLAANIKGIFSWCMHGAKAITRFEQSDNIAVMRLKLEQRITQ